MPVGDWVDELLTGLIDGQLTDDEKRQIDAALKQPEVQQRLQELQRIRSELRELSRLPSPGLPSDFSSKVIAACATLTRGAASSDAATGRRLRRGVMVLAALAAAIALAVWIPQRQQQDHRHLDQTPSLARQADRDASADATASPTDMALTPELPLQPSRASETISAGRMASGANRDLRLSLTMVLDVSISQFAAQDDTIRKLLSRFKIDIAQGVQANAEVETAINKLRYTVPDEIPVPAAQLYLISAPSSVLDAALAEIEKDIQSFPNYRFDLAFETPTASLIQALANASSQQLAAGQSVAVPIVDNSRESGAAPEFQSVPYQGTLVSANNRQRPAELELEPLPDDEACFLLLIIRRP
ncbi:MAG: hypothetical protein KF752_04430 [Pirellulaceae bacterium]|nr:hypothetical protein [Pirellulaceae bacterium]